MIKYFLLVAIFILFVPVSGHADRGIIYKRISSSSYHDVVKLFNEIGYTHDNWRAGVREVPRIELTHIPQRWKKESRKISVKEKKNIFFRLVGSAILIANERIREQRVQLLDKLKSDAAGDDPWVIELARDYELVDSEATPLTDAVIEELVKRVDEIPPSLALAQAAEESGWGTSRFAIQGNSLFGQWDFSGKGIQPKKQRKQLGNYGIARYEEPQDSVDAYMHNLNTHRAYRKLRDKRADMRMTGKELTGYELATTLDKYSERGTAYVKSLHGIMRYNHLDTADQAYLWDKGKIIVDPSED